MIDGLYFIANAFTESAFSAGSALDTALRFRNRLFRGETKLNLFKVVLPLSGLALRHLRPKFPGSILRNLHVFPPTQRFIQRVSAQY